MTIADFGRVLAGLLELDLDRCTLTYGVAPCTATGGPGEECYNTFRTCQDRVNYVKGVHTYRFIGRGTPVAAGELLRPYIVDLPARSDPELDPEKGLAPRNKISVTLSDEPDNDTEQDPYVANRATPAGGTFWSRLLARNPDHPGRPARVMKLYAEPGQPYTLSDPDWITESYVIDSLQGPDRNGQIRAVLTDPLKLTDRIKFPAPSSGELLAAITDTDLSLTLKSGQGAAYGTSGYVKLGEEVINFTGRTDDTLTWPGTGNRAQFGTVAAAHGADARVQLCFAWIAAAPDTVLEDLLNAAGILDANIDLAGMATIVDTWFSTYAITLCLTEPETVSKLLEEICVTLQAMLWWDPVAQKVKLTAKRPLSPLAATPPLLTDAANFIEGTVQVTRQDAERLTRVIVWYSLIRATANVTEWQSYERAAVAVDPDAEGANALNEVRQKVIYARFLDTASDQAAAELAVRLLLWHVDAPIYVRGQLDPKDEDIELGAQVDLETFGLTDFDGNIERQRVLVTKRQNNGADVDVTLIVTYLNRRYFWIAPDGHPDYSTATEEQKRYGYISDADGKLSDGSDGHVIA